MPNATNLAVTRAISFGDMQDTGVSPSGLQVLRFERTRSEAGRRSVGCDESCSRKRFPGFPGTAVAVTREWPGAARNALGCLL